MQTHVPHWQRLIIPVGFIIVCAIVAVFIWVKFGGALPLQAKSYRLTLPLPSAANLYPGSSITIAGVKVGRIIEVERVGRHADALLELDAEYVPLRSNATAILRTKTLLGEGYVEIAPGSASAPAVPEGGRLAAANIQPTQQLDDVLSTFTPGTRANLRDLLGGLARAFKGRASDVNAALGYAGPATANLAQVADTLDRQRTDVRRMISGSSSVLDALGRRQGVLQSAVVAGNRVLQTTARRHRELSATMEALPPFLHELRVASRSLGSASGDINRAVSALVPVLPQLTPALGSIDSAAPSFRGLFRELPATLSAGNRGLPAVDRLVKAAGSATKQVYPASRQLIPILQLLGLNRDSAVGFFANLGQFWNTSYVGPEGYIAHPISGIPSFWNEAIAGWVKRLPTNRFNPYPAPRSALDIARGGLKAYDCRNLKNRAYMPATGTGTPSCKLQGPWTFNGKTAYYPRTTLAPP